MVKSKKIFKILSIILIAICLLTVFGNVVNAKVPSLTVSAKEVAGAASKIGGISGNVFWLIQIAGVVMGVIILAYMGVKYITASPDGKAEVKKQAVIYVGGAALVSLAPTIAKWIFDAVG